MVPLEVDPSTHDINKKLVVSNGRELVASENEEILEPCEGMEFHSEEAARTFYSAYVLAKGCREVRVKKDVFGEHIQQQRAVTRVELMVTCEGNDSKVKSLVSEEAMVWEPFEGMVFESEEAVRTFYSIYAMHTGFRARVSGKCSLQRTLSMIAVKKLTSANWVVTMFVKKHNHALGTSKNLVHLQSDISTRKSLALSEAITLEALRFAQEGAVSDEIYNVALTALKEAVEKVTTAKRSAVTATQASHHVSGISKEDEVYSGILSMVGTDSFANTFHSSKIRLILPTRDGTKRGLAGALATPQPPVVFLVWPEDPRTSSFGGRAAPLCFT
ncbi:FHY3/FAR1 family protein [Dioscorea alata]|uniref:FHY3/FAR1 family protein n=1 Tax=Dioscorea alata TaxID=55571 RepID=A0ACB7WWB9_DIOAL|nr:FHY3/FAR1 family protein [Dioscorea alata]